MCGPRNTFVCLVAIALLTGCAGAALAVALPFADNFENISVGYYPNANGWRTGFSGITAYVSNSAACSPTRSFRLQSYPYWSRCDYVVMDEVPDRMAYQASVLMDPVRGRAAWVGLAAAAGDLIPRYNYFSFTNDTGLAGTVYFSGIDGLPPLIIGTFVVGQWITVGAEVDFKRQTADLWLDGMLAMSDVPIQPRAFNDPAYGVVILDRFAAAESNWNGGGYGVFYVDDVALLPLTPPAIEAVLDIRPAILNLRAKGRYVLCFIELPDGYSVADIVVASLLLNDTLPPAPMRPVIGDYDLDGVPDLMVRFSRAALARMVTRGNQEMVVTGFLADDTPLVGGTTLRVR
jgi:hypothetical protein